MHVRVRVQHTCSTRAYHKRAYMHTCTHAHMPARTHTGEPFDAKPAALDASIHTHVDTACRLAPRESLRDASHAHSCTPHAYACALMYAACICMRTRHMHAYERDASHAHSCTPHAYACARGICMHMNATPRMRALMYAAHMYMHTYIQKHVLKYAHTHSLTHTRTHTCTHTCIRTCICTYVGRRRLLREPRRNAARARPSRSTPPPAMV